MRFLRNVLEGLVCLVVFPLWLLLAFTGAPANWTALKLGVRRWNYFLRNGLRLYREAWWPLPQFEAASAFWRHWFWTEAFAARNAGCRHEPAKERYLIIKLAHIGDAMHIAPMLEALQAQRPDVEVDLLVGPWCEDLAKRWKVSGCIWVYTPHLMLFHRGNRKHLRSWKQEFDFFRELRDRHYRVVLSTSTLSMAEWMLIQAANPGQWIGADNPVTAWYPEIPKSTESYASREYEADRVGGLLRYLGLESVKGLPGFPVRDEEVAWAEEQWARGDGQRSEVGGQKSEVRGQRSAGEHPGRGARDERRVVVAPGAGWPGKIWPAERFGEVADWLIGELGCRVVLTGAPDEKALGETIEALCPKVVNLIGKTTFGQTAGLVKTADLLICNDSGPLHLAAAFGMSSLTLFGPAIASKWQPPGSQHKMIQKLGYCDGCVGWHPAAHCLHDGACMKAISVDEVREELAYQFKIKKEMNHEY